jgi:hypothetical protein
LLWKKKKLFNAHPSRYLFKPVSPMMYYKITDIEILEPGFDGGILIDSETYNIRLEMAKGTGNWKVLEDKVFSFGCGMIFKINHPLYEAFNAKIAQMISGGIIENIMSSYAKGRQKNYETIESDPEVFGLEKLTFGFEIWLYCLAICTAVFLLECCFRKMSKIRCEKLKLCIKC